MKSQYIFKYLVKGEELGYHLSTFCQVGEKEKAKVYNIALDNGENQASVILKNAKSMASGNRFAPEIWKDINPEDIEVVPEKLEKEVVIAFKPTALVSIDGTIDYY